MAASATVGSGSGSIAATIGSGSVGASSASGQAVSAPLAGAWLRSSLGHDSRPSLRLRSAWSMSAWAAAAAISGCCAWNEVSKRSSRSSVPAIGTQVRQRPESSFQQFRQVYCRQLMQKLNDSWKASSCWAASASSSLRIASPTASPRASWLMM